MNLNEFQQEAGRFAVYPGKNEEGIGGLVYCTLGLTGESGEVSEKVKKLLRDSNGIITDEIRRAIAYELSDVFWYLQQAATEIKYSLEDIGSMNIEKLRSRSQRGVMGGSGDNR